VAVHARFLFWIVTLSGAAACASIAHLDHSDTSGVGTNPGQVPDSGAIEMDGSVTSAQGVTITPTQLQFTANCGETKTGVINILNTSDTDRPYSIDIPANNTFALDVDAGTGGLTGTLKAHDHVAVTMQARSDAPGGDSVDIIITAGDFVQSVNLNSVVAGSTLSIEPKIADFGFVRQNTVSAPITAVFTNNGSQALTINGFAGLSTTDFDMEPPTVVVPGGGTPTTATITMKSAGAGPLVSNVVTPQIASGNTLCGQAAPQFTVTGQRVSTNVLVNPATADFGPQNCNAPVATTKVITLSNYDPANTVSYTVAIADPAFTVADPGAGNIAHANGATPATQNLTISATTDANPRAIATTLTIVATGVGVDGSPHTFSVPVTMTVSGAILQWDTGPLTFSNNGETKSATLENTGNAPTCVTISSSDDHFYTSSSTYSLNAPNGKSQPSIGFYPHYYNTDYSGKISVTQRSCGSGRPSAPFCSPPPTLAVSGRDDYVSHY
jgi:hypothetical protein